MKRAAVRAVFVLIGLAAFVFLWMSASSSPTSWQRFEERLPGLVHAEGFQIMELRSGGSDRVSLPMGTRIRQWLRPEPRTLGAIGFPESVVDFTLESSLTKSRIHCLARYSEGKVARIVVESQPADGSPEAERLGSVLQAAFPSIPVTITVHSPL